MMLIVGRFFLALVGGIASVISYVHVFEGEQTLGKIATLFVGATCTWFIVFSLLGLGKERT